VESPDSCLSYQWQASFGAGFLNLLNSGSYSGVNNDTLIINPVTVSMDNANYRCIISSCNACGDTSAIATLNIITGINETSQGSLNIYPNPSKDIFNIEVANLKNIDKVEVIDVMGKTIWQTFYEEMKPLQVNLSEFSSGIYTVKVTAGNSITTSRIVKD
jgi:hypothetical protein